MVERERDVCNISVWEDRGEGRERERDVCNISVWDDRGDR